MKIEKRKPKFKLGQVVTTPIGFRGIIISIKDKRNIKYIVSIDGLLGDHKISEKKLLKFNPEIKKECSISVIDEYGEFTDKTVESMGLIPCAAERFYQQVKDASAEKPKEPDSGASEGTPMSAFLWHDMAVAAHDGAFKRKDTPQPFKQGDLVEVKHTGVRLYVNGIHSIGGLYDIGIDWQIDCGVVIKDIHRDSLILIKRNKG